MLRAGAKKTWGRFGAGTSRVAQTGQWSDPMHSTHRSHAVNLLRNRTSCRKCITVGNISLTAKQEYKQEYKLNCIQEYIQEYKQEHRLPALCNNPSEAALDSFHKHGSYCKEKMTELWPWSKLSDGVHA